MGDGGWGLDPAPTSNKRNHEESDGGGWGSTGGGGGFGGSGGGGGGFGGGGGGGRNCYNCGASDHMSRECPEPKKQGGGGGGGGGRNCFNCNAADHMSRDCPEPKKQGGGGGGGGRNCFNCGGADHISRDCTEPKKQGGGDIQFGSRGRDRPSGQSMFGGEGGGGEGGEERPPPHIPEEIDLEAEGKLKYEQGINFDRFDRIEVDVKGADIKPIDKFADCIKSEMLLKNIELAGYKKMTPIQRYTLPALCQGHDLVGCAQTGSGKTAAFLLPVLQTILSDTNMSDSYNPECQQPHCIVIAPTRELARQTHVEALKLSRDSIVKCACIYGGTATNHMRAQLSRGANIITATPGRLKDFINRGWISLERVKYIILDEGDRLIDDGFVVDMRTLFSHPTMPPKDERQTMFFSATFKPDAQSLAREFMKPNYLFITVGMVGAANEDVKQEFISVERPEKKRELKKILQNLDPEDRVIVFTQTKATADVISGFLSSSGIECTSIHGDRHQSQREQALSEFKRGTKKCLVASPVGERGLDLPKVSMVINYDMPNELDEYIHRIGRTGRIGNTGRAISFFDPERDTKLIDALTKALKQAQQVVPDFFGSNQFAGDDQGFGDSGANAANGQASGDQAEDDPW